jgi:putative transcriptional regulator
MFEGYEPTRRGIEIIRDYTTGKMSFAEFIRAATDKAYER